MQTSLPNRTDGVNNPSSRKEIPLRYLRVPGCAASKVATFF